MVESLSSHSQPDALSAFLDEHQAHVPLLSGAEWSQTQVLDTLRKRLDAFFGALEGTQKYRYVELQRDVIQAQADMQSAIEQLTEQFERQSLASLTAQLKTLTGQDIDPKTARIHTRYLKQQEPLARRPRPVSDERSAEALPILSPHDGYFEKVHSMTLWEAACLNYSRLSGWSFPGRTSIADASYLDKGINATARQFIDLVQSLNLGQTLKTYLVEAFSVPPTATVLQHMAEMQLRFAAVEALRNSADSGVDSEKFQWLERAFEDKALWSDAEEMSVFIPHGVDNISWIPQQMGLVGYYRSAPPGDHLSILHVVFSIKGCAGVFSYFPGRPGGDLRHHDSFGTACAEFYVAFQAFYRAGHVDWLYPVLSLPDFVRLKRVVTPRRPMENLQPFAEFLYQMSRHITTPIKVNAEKIGYARFPVKKTPIESIRDLYGKRCRANLEEMATPTPGFMETLLEILETLLAEILGVLLIPVPGPLKGLGRVRMFAMFFALGRGFIDGGVSAVRGQSADLVQAFVDLADLLISGRLHTRLARTVKRRHGALYERLMQQRHAIIDLEPETVPALSTVQRLERMLGAPQAPVQALDTLLRISNTSQDRLLEVWNGARPSASLVQAAQRFNADRLIDWIVSAPASSTLAPVGSYEALAPLLTQLSEWPANTSLRIENQQGQLLRRYSRDVAQATVVDVTVTLWENHLFAYSRSKGMSAYLPEVVLQLLPSAFMADSSDSAAQSRLERLRERLVSRALTLRVPLFEALMASGHTRQTAAGGALASVQKLLPDFIGGDRPVCVVVEKLQALHPQVPLVHLMEVLRRHPLSTHQQEQLLISELQPEALYTALRAARERARQDALVDAIYHPRRYSQHTQDWVQALAPALIRAVTGQALVLAAAQVPVPYRSQGQDDRTVVVTDHGRGRFAAFYHRDNRHGPVIEGPNSFYEAVVQQLSEAECARLKGEAVSIVSGLRGMVADELLKNRTADGSFLPGAAEIARYECDVSALAALMEPDGLGLYRADTHRYLQLEDQWFRVAQADSAAPWCIQHPSLALAYAPQLTHNGVGAWRHEWENPLTWDAHQLMRRLGGLTRGLNQQTLGHIQRVSGITEPCMRRVLVRNEAPPGVLVASVERFRIHQRVKDGIRDGADFYDRLLGEVGADAADELVGRPDVERPEQVLVLESKVEMDPLQMEPLLFEALCQAAQTSSEPLAQTIQRDFPSLPAAVAEELLRHATPAQRQQLTAGRVPLPLAREARWLVQDWRFSQACQGLYLKAAANVDSHRLILHTLPTLQGWPEHVRLEIREGARLVDSVGAAQASVQRVLRRVARRYQAYSRDTNGNERALGQSGAFLPVLLAALPASERSTLGYTEAGGEDRLLAHIAERVTAEPQRSRAVLHLTGRQPWFNPPRRLADGRVGYPLSGDGVQAQAYEGQLERVRELFPNKTDEQAAFLLRGYGRTFDMRKRMIDWLFRERDHLNRELERWLSQAATPEARVGRQIAVERIQRCWRQEPSGPGADVLDLDDLDLSDLPQLQPLQPQTEKQPQLRLSHITTLSLRNNQLSELSPSLLRSFPSLTHVQCEGNRLEHIPRVLSELYRLRSLDLSRNLIKPNLADVRLLSSLKGLETLDLSGNPLGRGVRLDLYGLTNLERLNLRDTKINVLPKGAVTLRALRYFDLRDNHLTVLTSSDLYLLENVHRAMNLGGNRLSQATLKLLNDLRLKPEYQFVDFGLWVNDQAPLPSIDRWLVFVPLDEVSYCREAWSELSAQPMADGFFKLLWRLGNDARLLLRENLPLRQDLTQRIWRIILSAAHNNRVKQVFLTTTFEYMEGGLDGWVLSVLDLEYSLLPLHWLSGNLDVAAPDFLQYYQALRRHWFIKENIKQVLPENNPVAIASHILALRIALAGDLRLPYAFAGRFNHLGGGPSAATRESLRGAILGEEATCDWVDYFRGREYWVEFLERKYPQRFASVRESSDRDFERVTEKAVAGEITDGPYKREIDRIAQRRNEAETPLLLELTTTAWTEYQSS